MNTPLLLFDIDGTLCDTFAVDDACYCAAVSRVLGMPVTETSWQEAAHITDPGVTEWLWRKHLGRSPAPEEVEALVHAYESALLRELRNAPERFRAMSGAREFLDALSAEQSNVAIATGAWARLARLKLTAGHLPVELLLASGDDSHDRLEIFRLAAERAAQRTSKPSQTVLVGDGVWDIRVANAHGWRFLGVGKGERAERLVAEGATVVVGDFLELPRLFEFLHSR